MIIDYLFREICVILDRLGDSYYGRCVVMLGDPPTLPYRQVRSWGWGAKQYCACFTRLREHKLYCVPRNERERNPLPLYYNLPRYYSAK